MNKLNYNRVTKELYDISKEEKKSFGSIEITEDDKREILKELNNGKVCLVNTETKEYYFEEYYSACDKRCEIVTVRDKLLIAQDPYHTEHYQAYLSLKDVIIDDKYFTDLNSYYADLLDLPNAFDACSDQKSFSFVFVEEKSEVEDECVYELVKPSFIK